MPLKVRSGPRAGLVPVASCTISSWSRLLFFHFLKLLSCMPDSLVRRYILRADPPAICMELACPPPIRRISGPEPGRALPLTRVDVKTVEFGERCRSGIPWIFPIDRTRGKAGSTEDAGGIPPNPAD